MLARSGALVAALALLAGRGAAAQPTRPSAAMPDSAVDQVRIDSVLDLDAIVRRALAVSPATSQARAGVRSARSEARVATGAYAPSLQFNTTALRSDVVSGSSLLPGSDNAYSAGLAATMDVFTGGRRGADYARAQADVDAAEANDVNQRFAVTLAAQRAYYDVLRAQELVQVARARVAEGTQGLRYALDRTRAGTATKSDELRARLELTAGQQQLVASLDTLQTAAYTLGRLVGSDVPVGAQAPATLEPLPLQLGDSAIVRLAVQSSPAVQSARSASAASRAATRSARSQYLPDLRVTGGYNWADQSLVAGAVRPGWVVGVGTSFPVFDNFRREDAVERAEAAAEVARVTASDVQREARTDAARLLSALRFAERNIGLAGTAVQAATEDLRVQSERYRAGISTSLDQLNSELAVTQARLGLVAARFQYQIVRAQLDALVGRRL